MLEIRIEKAFKKDIQRDKKSGNYSVDDFEILKTIIEKLQNNIIIDAKYKRHILQGNMKNIESIHIKGNWLLIFNIDIKFLNLFMLGKHTQVYKKFK